MEAAHADLPEAVQWAAAAGAGFLAAVVVDTAAVADADNEAIKLYARLGRNCRSLPKGIHRARTMIPSSLPRVIPVVGFGAANESSKAGYQSVSTSVY